jgi:hypothetical protein
VSRVRYDAVDSGLSYNAICLEVTHTIVSLCGSPHDDMGPQRAFVSPADLFSPPSPIPQVHWYRRHYRAVPNLPTATFGGGAH